MLAGIALIASVALATEPDATAPDATAPGATAPGATALPGDEGPDDGQLALDALRAQVEAAREEGALARRHLSTLQTILGDAAVLLDGRRSTSDRAAAARRLGPQPAAVPFLRAAAFSREVPVQVAAVRAVSALDSAESVGLAADVLADPDVALEVREEAVQTLVMLGRPDAAEALWSAANSGQLPARLRRVAADGLARAYPQVIARRGSPRPATDGLGVVAGTMGNGLAGGVLLSAVGQWGRNDAATVIGAVGGSSIGVGTGVLVGTTRSVSRGQGLRYLSDVGWGLTGAIMATESTFGRVQPPGSRAEVQRSNMGALYRTIGVGAGVGLGIAGLSRDPDPVDVIEQDIAIWGVGQIAWGVADLGFGASAQRWCDGDSAAVDQDGIDTGSAGVVEAPGCPEYDTWYRTTQGVAVAGGATGLAVALAFREPWELSGRDVLFAGALASETAWLGTWLPTAAGWEEPSGHVRASLHGGFVLGLTISALHPIPVGTSAGVGWGALLGNGMGAGVPLLMGNTEDRTIAAIMLPMGVIGAAGGGLYGQQTHWSPGDWAMVSVGMPIALAQAGSIGAWLNRSSLNWDGDQTGGLVLVGGGLSGVGFSALAQRFDPSSTEMFFLGGAGAWGAWYGALTPLALNTVGQDDDLLLISPITADVFMGAAGLAISDKVGLDPRRTVVPQLMGAAGATVGGLGAAMVTDDGRSVAVGTLLGSTGGLLAGALIESSRKTSAHSSWMPTRPHLGVPGRWGFSVVPTVMADGQTGVQASIQASGL